MDSNSCDHIDISWQSADSASFLEYGLQGFQRGQGIFQGRVSKPYIIDHLSAGTTYDIYIADTCSGGIFFNAGPFTFTTDSTPLPTAKITRISDSISGGQHHFILSSDSSKHASTYFWDFGNGDTASGSSGVASYASAGSYTVQLITINDCGRDTTALALNTNIGYAEDALQKGVHVYPNPAQSKLKIKLSPIWLGHQAIFGIYSAEGRLVQKIPVDQAEVEIDLHELPEGLYLWEAKSRTASATGKFVKR